MISGGGCWNVFRREYARVGIRLNTVVFSQQYYGGLYD